MTALPNNIACTTLRVWREKKLNNGFFFWLTVLGRKDEEVVGISHRIEDNKLVVTFNDDTTSETYLELEY